MRGFKPTRPLNGAIIFVTDGQMEEALGIPAATLAGLRDGSLVAAPREPMEELLRRWGAWTPLQQPFIGTAKEARKREAESREAGVRLLLAGAYLAYEVTAIRGAAAQEPGHE